MAQEFSINLCANYRLVRKQGSQQDFRCGRHTKMQESSGAKFILLLNSNYLTTGPTWHRGASSCVVLHQIFCWLPCYCYIIHGLMLICNMLSAFRNLFMLSMLSDASAWWNTNFDFGVTVEEVGLELLSIDSWIWTLIGARGPSGDSRCWFGSISVQRSNGSLWWWISNMVIMAAASNPSLRLNASGKKNFVALRNDGRNGYFGGGKPSNGYFATSCPSFQQAELFNSSSWRQLKSTDGHCGILPRWQQYIKLDCFRCNLKNHNKL